MKASCAWSSICDLWVFSAPSDVCENGSSNLFPFLLHSPTVWYVMRGNRRNRTDFRWRRSPVNEGSLSGNVRHQDDGISSDLPGFYYDDEKKRYFRIVPGQNRNNPITAASIRAHKAAKLGAQISEASRKRRVNPLPKALNSLQLGGLHNANFAASVRSSKMVSLTMSSETSLTAASNDVISASGGTITDVEECTYLIGCPHRGVLIGSWATKSAHGQRGNVVRCLEVDENGIKPGVVVNVHPMHKVVDLCATEEGRQLYVTYACVNSDCTGRPSTIISTRAVKNDDPIQSLAAVETRELASSAAWSCARSWDNRRTVVGLEGRAELFDRERHNSSRLWTRRENPFSLQFDRSGDVIYAGTNKGSLLGIDLRDHPSSSAAFSVHIGRGVTFISLIDREDMLLGSAYDGKLVMVDLKERKVVQEYKGHSNDGIKIPFSYDSVDKVVCSAGQDRIVRIWKLSGGEGICEPITAVVPPDGQRQQPWSWYSSSWGHAPGKAVLCLTLGTMGYMYT